MIGATNVEGAAPPPPPASKAWGSKTFAAVVGGLGSSVTPPSERVFSRFKGMPSITFQDDDANLLADKHKRALVGYFFNGRPPMASLRKAFELIGFKGAFYLGILERKHILIRFEFEEDYIRCWNRQRWDIFGNLMRVTKWTPEFQPNVESSIVPIWLNFENLPIHLHDQRALFDIARLIGRPLKLDAATASLAKPSVARIFVEVDLTKEMPRKIWIQCGSFGFSQTVGYENRPMYCNGYLHLGHLEASCPKRHGNISMGAKGNTDTVPISGKSALPNSGKSTLPFTEKWVQKNSSIGKTITISDGELGKQVVNKLPLASDKGKSVDTACIPSSSNALDKGKSVVTACIPSSSNALDVDSETDTSQEIETIVPKEVEIFAQTQEVGNMLATQGLEDGEDPIKYVPAKDSKLKALLQMHIPWLDDTSHRISSVIKDDFHLNMMQKISNFDEELESKRTFSEGEKSKSIPLHNWEEGWHILSSLQNMHF